jgi:hypothetical protein
VESYTVDGILVTRGNGDFPDRTDVSDREWFKNTLNRQTIYREAVIAPKTNQLSIIFADPIWSVNTLDLGNKGSLVCLFCSNRRSYHELPLHYIYLWFSKKEKRCKFIGNIVPIWRAANRA